MSEASRKLLIVEDDPGLLNQLKWCFDGYDVYTADDRVSAIVELRRHEPMVILQDLGLPPKPESVEEGFLTLGEILKLAPHTKVIVVTGNGDQENALTAVAQGAYDFYEKPVDTDILKLLVDRAFNISELESENRKLQGQVNESPLDGIIAASEGMLAVCRMIEKVAPTDVTTFLLGESGTGKELLARAIHRLSPRAENIFVAINCAAIPENLLESELFGHEKGSFTGAHKQTLGKVELASGGTLFLDEIGNISMSTQAKLLRFIEAREYKAVGDTQSKSVNIRLVTATNKDLESMVADGNFRDDLYYRINIFPIEIPPLRDRRDDIPSLAFHFLNQFSKEMGRQVKEYSAGAMNLLMNHDWPGNVRELENSVHRAVILASDETVRQAHLVNILEMQPLVDLNVPRTSEELKSVKKITRQKSVENVEKLFVLGALKRNGWSVTASAEETGMQRTNFQALMKKYDIRIRGKSQDDDNTEDT